MGGLPDDGEGREVEVERLLIPPGVPLGVASEASGVSFAVAFMSRHFLHHVPEVEMKNDGSVMKTAHRVAADGWEVDWPLWADAAKCGPCHHGNDAH